MLNVYGAILRLTKNNRGQVAIFVALIFQVLFLFFAMVVNVGLLVHHKINLQNSVDLAAYYGAMKQAEMLNAMAHVNYQIRQSWKLLAWRYRVIGSGGDRSTMEGTGQGNPFRFESTKATDLESWVNPDSDEENRMKMGYYRMPSFCINYNPFDPAAQLNENTCKRISDNKFAIQVLKVPALSVNQNYAKVITDNVKNAQDAQIKNCLEAGVVNYSVLSTFSVGYLFDQYARRFLLAQMSKALSQSPQGFIDIDGEQARQGIQKTLEKNMTDANREGLVDFEVFNGLGSGDCATSQGNKDAANWLKDISIFPLLVYQDNADTALNTTRGVKEDACKYKFKVMTGDENNTEFGVPTVLADPSIARGPYRERVEQLKDFTGIPGNRDFRYTLGYEKDPWCMAYVGVKAKTRPKIPFAPAAIELSAKSFAKPFGGRFGPWYNNRWDRGAQTSSGDLAQRLDRLLPRRVNGNLDPAALVDLINKIKESTNAPISEDVGANYSRFPGDRVGLMSMRALGEYTRALHSIAIPFTGTTETALHAMNWFHITENISESNNPKQDSLYWNRFDATSKIPLLRKLEVAAIAPDIFDTTYYSIDPNFYENYYLRIKKGKLLSEIKYPINLRSDLGSRQNETEDLKKFSVTDQIKYFNELNNPSGGSPLKINGEQILLHTLKNPFQVLTGWTSKNLFNYGALDSESSQYFGKCLTAAEDPDKKSDGPSIKDIAAQKFTPVPGNCVIGGRTGYSVKLVSKDYLLNSNLPLGGAGGSTGSIKNQPPLDW